MLFSNFVLSMPVNINLFKSVMVCYRSTNLQTPLKTLLPRSTVETSTRQQYVCVQYVCVQYVCVPVATELGGPWGHVPPQNALRYLRVRVTLTLTLTLRHRVSSVLGFLWPDKPLCPPTQQRLPSPMCTVCMCTVCMCANKLGRQLLIDKPV